MVLGWLDKDIEASDKKALDRARSKKKRQIADIINNKRLIPFKKVLLFGFCFFILGIMIAATMCIIFDTPVTQIKFRDVNHEKVIENFRDVCMGKPINGSGCVIIKGDLLDGFLLDCTERVR